MKTTRKIMLVALSALALPLAASATTIDTANYNHAMTIRPASGKISTTLSNFPLLVRLSTARQPWFDPADCGTGGADLRFSLADGTLLSHEIDYWNVNGESTVWVNVPSLSADTEITAYWGVRNPALAPTVNAADTWPDFVAVYHLGGSTTARDSSGNGYDATNVAGVSAGANPIVGGCAAISNTFETTVTDLTSASATKRLADRTKITISGWLAVDAFSSASHNINIARKMSGWDNKTGGFQFRYFPDNNLGGSGAAKPTLAMVCNSGTGNAGICNWCSYPSQSNNEWIYFTCAMNGDDGTKYVNGAKLETMKAASVKPTPSHGILDPDTGTLTFGPASTDIRCRMDEMRIRNGVAPAAWVAADYAQQTDASFLDYEEITGRTFTVVPIPDQTVSSLAELAAGVTPSVTVSNMMAGVALVQGTHYTVAYSNNTACGVATAIVTGIGGYAGMGESVDFIIHAIKNVSADLDLAADEDWTGFEAVTVASGVTIDLLGHNLTISGLNGSGTITDSVGGGELHYSVPATSTGGYEAKIESVSLTGLLKLVKEGPGLLVSTKANQSYTGGTDIIGGAMRTTRQPANNPLGPASSQSHVRLYIGPNGAFDPAGTVGWGNYDLTIAGGMVSNTVANASTSPGFNANITFTDDSTFATMADYWWNVGELGGHTVSVYIAAGKNLYVTRSARATESGRLALVRGGFLRTFSTREAKLDSVALEASNAALWIEGPMDVRDYRSSYANNYGMGSAALNVYGTFTPDGVYFYGPTMQDGSAIDLSAKAGAWNVTSSLTQGGNATTKFASGAGVAILLGGRTPSLGEKIVAWTAETKPADSVSLTNDTYVLRAKSDGLYVDSRRSFAATDIPDIAEVAFSSDIPATIEFALALTNLVTGDTLVRGEDYTYGYVVTGRNCTVTVTGLGTYAGEHVVRTFSVGRYVVNPKVFTHSMDISPNAGKVTTTFADFPLLVRLSRDIPHFSYRTCKADELRFALPDGTLLAHEIDHWDENGESTVWVNVPSLSADTVIRAYWGLGYRRDQFCMPVSETWPGHVGVWHFSEESGIIHDSSGNGYDSEGDGGGTGSNTNAMVGLARNTIGTAFYTTTNLKGATVPKPLTSISKFSVSGWMIATNFSNYSIMMLKNQGHGTSGWYAAFDTGPTKFDAVGSGKNFKVRTLPTPVDNNWIYLTVVFNGTACGVYENGQIVKAGTEAQFVIDTVVNTSDQLRFAQGFKGRIDEFRIRDGASSSAYIAADYATQADPEFLVFGEVRSKASTVIMLQ